MKGFVVRGQLVKHMRITKISIQWWKKKRSTSRYFFWSNFCLSFFTPLSHSRSGDWGKNDYLSSYDGNDGDIIVEKWWSRPEKLKWLMMKQEQHISTKIHVLPWPWALGKLEAKLQSFLINVHSFWLRVDNKEQLSHL